jgi:histidyl-tRNA synthetase
MGGGRYDRLVSELGGSDLPAVGFACGMERLILAMETAGTTSADSSLDVFLVDVAEKPEQAMKYLTSLRKRGIAADMDYLGRSMKANMKAASRSGARFAVIIEPDNDMVSVKDLSTSEQRTVPFDLFLTELSLMKNNERK